MTIASLVGSSCNQKTKANNITRSTDLFASTAWIFAIPRPGQLCFWFIHGVDGQVAHLIVVGDQMHPTQPPHNTHPREDGLWALEVLFGNHSAIILDRGCRLSSPDVSSLGAPSVLVFVGLFLMPSVVVAPQPIQGALNMGRNPQRLHPPEDNLLRGNLLEDSPLEGIGMIPTTHEGCAKKCAAESEMLQAKYHALGGQEGSCPRHRRVRKVIKGDILAPTPRHKPTAWLSSRHEGPRWMLLIHFKTKNACCADFYGAIQRQRLAAQPTQATRHTASIAGNAMGGSMKLIKVFVCWLKAHIPTFFGEAA